MHGKHCFVETEYDIVFTFKIKHDGVLPIESEMEVDQANLSMAFNDVLKEKLNCHFPGKALSIKQLPSKHTYFFCATHIIYGVNNTSIYLEYVGDEENHKFVVDARSYNHEREYIFGSTSVITQITASLINGKYYYERKDGVLCPIKEIEPTEPS